MTEVTNSISREEFQSLLNNQTDELKNLKDELDKKMEEIINNYTQGTTSSILSCTHLLMLPEYN